VNSKPQGFEFLTKIKISNIKIWKFITCFGEVFANQKGWRSIITKYISCLLALSK